MMILNKFSLKPRGKFYIFNFKILLGPSLFSQISSFVRINRGFFKQNGGESNYNSEECAAGLEQLLPNGPRLK